MTTQEYQDLLEYQRQQNYNDYAFEETLFGYQLTIL